MKYNNLLLLIIVGVVIYFVMKSDKDENKKSPDSKTYGVPILDDLGNTVKDLLKEIGANKPATGPTP